MLTVWEAIQQRRSIRSFRNDPVPDEVIHQMQEAARLAPSGSNRQPWRFIVVTDAEEKAKLRKILMDQAFVEEAPVLFVCCADLAAYSTASARERYQEFINHGVMETLTGRFADPAFWASRLAEEPEARTALIRALTATFIAVEHSVLTATALGLGTCWVGAWGNEEVKALFGLPDSMEVATVLAVGYPAKIPPPRPRLSLPEILLRPLPTTSR